MNKGYKYRIYPNKKQKVLIDKTIGCSRFVYNYILGKAIEYYELKRRKVACYGNDGQGNRVYTVHGKSVTLCGEGGGRGAKTGLYLFGCITPYRIEKQHNGQRFSEGTKFYTLTAQDKHGVIVDGYIRKLTPLECERLQTVPDNYTSCISDSQRYKCLGNGWTVDVIAHILGGII